MEVIKRFSIIFTEVMDVSLVKEIKEKKLRSASNVPVKGKVS